MEQPHLYTEKDTLAAQVLLKTTELARSWGADIVKIAFTGQNGENDPHVYIQNSEGRVMEAYVRDRALNGTQFIDIEQYTIGGEYHAWNCSTPEVFFEEMDADIASASSPHVENASYRMGA